MWLNVCDCDETYRCAKKDDFWDSCAWRSLWNRCDIWMAMNHCAHTYAISNRLALGRISNKDYIYVVFPVWIGCLFFMINKNRSVSTVYQQTFIVVEHSRRFMSWNFYDEILTIVLCEFVLICYMAYFVTCDDLTIGLSSLATISHTKRKKSPRTKYTNKLFPIWFA